MSRRFRDRAAADKRDISIELASLCGHGTDLPEEEQDEPQEPEWQDMLPRDERVQVGPLDI